MAPKIKLQRVGTKKKPKYRVVIQEERSKLNGKVIEILGSYQPRREPLLFEVDKEKVLDWIKKGAQPTDKVRILLGKAGIMPPVDLAALPKRKTKGEAPAQPEAAAPAPAEAPKPEAPQKEEKKEEPKEAPKEAPAETPKEAPAEAPKEAA